MPRRHVPIAFARRPVVHDRTLVALGQGEVRPVGHVRRDLAVGTIPIVASYCRRFKPATIQAAKALASIVKAELFFIFPVDQTH